MFANSTLPCWEIMNCKKDKSCPAKNFPDKYCWEIANELDDYRNAFNICRDCVVYVIKNKETILTEKEVHTIMQQKVACALA